MPLPDPAVRRGARRRRQAESGRSNAHFVYVGFEVVKVVALLVGGILLLSA